MMMMPFVRLIAIYAIVGAAIFAFLKRDEIMANMSQPESPAFAAPIAAPMAAPAEEAPAAAPPAEDAQVEAAEATPPQAVPATAPRAFGTQITPQYFGQSAAPAASKAPTEPASLTERWSQARDLFIQGKTNEATALYEALAAEFPDNMDLRGETGNLYYNLGEFNKAATHYQAVGEIAGRDGNMQIAGSMLGLLQRIAPTKATALQATLAAGR